MGLRLMLSWLSEGIKVVKPPVPLKGRPTDQKVRGSNPLQRANPDTALQCRDFCFSKKENSPRLFSFFILLSNC